MALYDKADIRSNVHALFGRVFSYSGQVLRDAGIYPFSLMEEMPDPNIHQILLNLRILDNVMTTIMIANDEGDFLGHDDFRRLINAREQVQRMERIAVALKKNDEVAYQEAINALVTQVDF